MARHTGCLEAFLYFLEHLVRKMAFSHEGEENNLAATYPHKRGSFNPQGHERKVESENKQQYRE
jgi:hypothetical protein